MLKRTSLYGVAAIALSFAALPVCAQTASYTATTPPAKATSAAATSSAPAPAAPKTTSSGLMDLSSSSSTISPLDDMAAEAVAETDSMIDSLNGDQAGDIIRPGKSIDDNKPRWYDDDGNPFSDKYYEDEGGGILLALQRDPQLPPGHFLLSMIGSQSFVSCMKVHAPKFSTEFNQSGIMTVKIEKFRVDKRDMPRYPHYECNTAPQQITMNVNLSKDLLQENNVKKIKFKMGKSSETYLVKVTDHYVQLTPESRNYPQMLRIRPLEVNGVATTMKLWFYPENTVILSADGADKDITLEGRLLELASAKGLTPLGDVIPEHTTFRKAAGHYYFVDKSARYRVGNGELFDYIQADAMKYGLEADEPVKKNVAVFIRKPGQYD